MGSVDRLIRALVEGVLFPGELGRVGEDKGSGQGVAAQTLKESKYCINTIPA